MIIYNDNNNDILIKIRKYQTCHKKFGMKKDFN